MATNENSDSGYSPSQWAFDDEVTRVFDDMLARSIPQYEVMRKAVFDLACRFVQPKTDILDMGCSRGEAIAPLIRKFRTDNRYIGVEVSPPMLEATRERFKEEISSGIVRIEELDLRQDYPSVNTSVTLCVLTLQFVPIEYRQRVLREVYKSTTSGGVLIIVEKVLGNTADLDEIMVDSYYAMKKDYGYTQDEIERKRLALEGVLVPVTVHFNEELFKMAGFQQIDCFWRWMNFAGWLAIRE